MSDRNNIRQELYELLAEYRYSILHLIENAVDEDDDTYVDHDHDCDCECPISYSTCGLNRPSGEIANDIARLIYNDVLDADKIERLITIGELAKNIRDGDGTKIPPKRGKYVEFDETMKALM